jgi:REP element-mobilizing transposase RayT
VIVYERVGSYRTSQIENLRYGRVQLVQLCATLHDCVSGFFRQFVGVLPQENNPRIQRVKFELRAEGIKTEEANPLRSGVHTRGFLPHVKREGARYFVTFRLADSLPKEVLLKYQAERARRLQVLRTQEEAAKQLRKPIKSDDSIEKIERDYFRKLEGFLDKNHGCCSLKRTEIANLVAGALLFFDGERYRLDAWVIMPNHVHVVFWPIPNNTVSEIVQSWKRFTAREANKILGTTGQPFWQPEAFDHWIRNDEEHARCCRYVINNPVKARVCAGPEVWKWSSAWRGNVQAP